MRSSLRLLFGLVLTVVYVFIAVLLIKVLRGRSNHEEIVYINSTGDIVLDPAQAHTASKCPPTAGSQLPKGLDAVFVSSAPGNIERQKLLRHNLERHEIETYEIRTEWTVKRVKAEMSTLSSIFRSANAPDVPAGMVARHSTGSDDFEWQNPTVAQGHQMVSTSVSVLQTLANLAQHHQFYKDIAQRGAKLSLVLEDDATLVPCFKSEVEQTLAGTLRGRFTAKHPKGCLSGSGKCLCIDAQMVILFRWQLQSFRNIDPALESYLFRLFPDFYWSEPALVYESSKAFDPTLRWQLFGSSVGGEKSYRGASSYTSLVEWTSRTLDTLWWDTPILAFVMFVLLLLGYLLAIKALIGSRQFPRLIELRRLMKSRLC